MLMDRALRLFLALTLFLQPAGLPVAMADAPTITGADRYQIEFDSTNTRVKYGEYTELELVVRNAPNESSFQWEAAVANLPAGLSFSESNSSTVLIFGVPKFTGTWCSAILAKTSDQVYGVANICWQAQDNAALSHPRFLEDRTLPDFVRGEYKEYRLNFSVAEGASYIAELADGTLPEGLKFSTKADRPRFLIFGRADTEGVSTVSFRVTDSLGRETSRQFQIEVVEPQLDNPSPGSPIYSCAPGYYFDDNLGYCVSTGINCGSGTYYDPDTNSCRAYVSPTPDYCGRDAYFDNYLGRCVAIDYPRCPVNYRYDSYYNRCVREPYTCSAGYYYDWEYRSCRSGYHSCPAGSYYDSYSNTCRVVPRSCPAGYDRDYYRNVCVPHGRYHPPARPIRPQPPHPPARPLPPSRPVPPPHRPPPHRPQPPPPSRPVPPPHRPQPPPPSRPVPPPHRPQPPPPSRPVPPPHRPQPPPPSRPVPPPHRPQPPPPSRPVPPPHRPQPPPPVARPNPPARPLPNPPSRPPGPPACPPHRPGCR